MADIMGLVKALKDKAIEQYGKGAPYREALASALRGDTKGINQALSKSDLTPMDFATTFAPLGITAWHGSPYTFDKFELSKIGSGEGNQAFGHGLYFAENPAVAQTYKMPSRGAEATAATHLKMYKTPENAISALEDQLTSNITKLGRQHTQEAIDLLKSGKATTGNMYKVDIADESIPNMMDWNKSIGEQPLHIQKAIENTKSMLPQNAIDDLGGDLSLLYGKDVMPVEFLNTWESLTGSTGSGEKALHHHGVSGIRYLDQGSRNGMEGTSNYVVFDPNTVKILERK